MRTTVSTSARCLRHHRIKPNLKRDVPCGTTAALRLISRISRASGRPVDADTFAAFCRSSKLAIKANVAACCRRSSPGGPRRARVVAEAPTSAGRPPEGAPAAFRPHRDGELGDLSV